MFTFDPPDLMNTSLLPDTSTNLNEPSGIPLVPPVCSPLNINCLADSVGSENEVLANKFNPV